MEPLVLLYALLLLSRQGNSRKDPPLILVYVDANCLIWDFFLVVCRSRKRYALYLILLPKFHPIVTTLKLLTLGVSPKDILPNPISQASFLKKTLFYGVPCALCTNFFAGRERIDELDMFVEVLFLCLCCCLCTEAKRSPSSLSMYLLFDLFHFCPFTCSVFTCFSTLSSFSVLLSGSPVCMAGPFLLTVYCLNHYQRSTSWFLMTPNQRLVCCTLDLRRWVDKN